MRVFEVCNGDKSDFFGWEEDAKEFAKSAYDNNEDGVPFIVPHFVERPDEFAALLNKVARAPKGAATGAEISANPCSGKEFITNGH